MPTTSLKLPLALKVQIDDAARKAGISVHAFILKTLSDGTEQARLREQFSQDSLAALREVGETGLTHDLDDVRNYFNAMAAYRRGERLRPEQLVPKKWESQHGIRQTGR